MADMAASRLTQLSQQVSGLSGNPVDALLAKNPDDIVITGALRTAFTRGGKGGFKDTPAADLLAGVLKALTDKSVCAPILVTLCKQRLMCNRELTQLS